MVNLTRIYTRTGDAGRTRLGDMSETSKNDLRDVGADFCTPIVENPEFPPLRIEQEYVDRLEAWCDQYNEDLENLRSFILNGGTPGAALLQVARTVTRRAERSAWAAYA